MAAPAPASGLLRPSPPQFRASRAVNRPPSFSPPRLAFLYEEAEDVEVTGNEVTGETPRRAAPKRWRLSMPFR